MAGLQYVGRIADTEAGLVVKSTSDLTGQSLRVTSDFVTAQTNLVTPYLATQDYLTSQIASRVSSSQMDTLLSTCISASLVGAHGGVATLTGTGVLTSSQIPSGVPVDRVATCITASGSGILLSPGSTVTVTDTTMRAVKLASVTIPDPGWAYRPLPFAVVAGTSLGPAPERLITGTGTFGQLAVMPPLGVSNTVYGHTLTSSSYGYYNSYVLTPAIPTAQLSATPLTIPAVTGSLELDLYGSVGYVGANSVGYSWAGDNLVFYVLIWPAP